MRKIELAVVDLELQVYDPATKAPLVQKLDYAELIESILAAPPERGMTLGEMKQALEVIELIKRAKAGGAGFVLLEESQWGYLNQKVQGNSWRIVNQVVLDFAEAIEKAEKIDFNLPKES